LQLFSSPRTQPQQQLLGWALCKAWPQSLKEANGSGAFKVHLGLYGSQHTDSLLSLPGLWQWILINAHSFWGDEASDCVTAPADQIQLLTLLHERNPLGCTGNPRPGCDSHPVTEASPAIMSPVSGCSCAYQSLICSSSLPTARWLWVDVMVLISSA